MEISTYDSGLVLPVDLGPSRKLNSVVFGRALKDNQSYRSIRDLAGEANVLRESSIPPF